LNELILAPAGVAPASSSHQKYNEKHDYGFHLDFPSQRKPIHWLYFLRVSIMDGLFRLGFVGSPRRRKDGDTCDYGCCAKDSRHRISLVLCLTYRSLDRAATNFFWR
jgi:hypothetical protein